MRWSSVSKPHPRQCAPRWCRFTASQRRASPGFLFGGTVPEKRERTRRFGVITADPCLIACHARPKHVRYLARIGTTLAFLFLQVGVFSPVSRADPLIGGGLDAPPALGIYQPALPDDLSKLADYEQRAGRHLP